MSFINDNFMLQTETARKLYHEHAAKMPIIDYHCHLVPQQIAENIQFRDITQLWLVDGHYGDHYKWRAMRANGVSEDYLTGGKHTAWETFEKWAETVPYTMRNPLYHWTHLELSRVFGIDKLLCPATAREIFEECNAKLATPEFRGQALIRKFGVEVVCTTDDPADDLRWHKMIAEHPFGTKVIPAWRPDKAMAIENPAAYKAYLKQLGEAADMEIDSYADLCEALKKRHDFFASMGCKLSDHGLENFYAADYKEIEIELIFKKVLMGIAPNAKELEKFRSAFLHDQAVMDAEAGWAQQFHIGAIRNNNTKMFNEVGPDTGYDAIHDPEIAAAGHRFFDRLTLEGKLAKTILYCLNPKDNAQCRDDDDGLHLQRRHLPGQDAVRFGLVVPGSGSGHAPSAGLPVRAGSPEPFRGHAHGQPQLHQLPAPRVLPPHPLRRPGQGRGAGQAPGLRARLHRQDGRGHLLQQREELL